jgi:hypothetical protein
MPGVMDERSLNTPDDIRQKTSPIEDAMESLYVLNEVNEIREAPGSSFFMHFPFP